MTTRTSRQIPWDIYEEHLDEAAFLWGQWEDALVAANYTLDEVAAGPEARLLAHLDGLVLGGAPVAEKLLRPTLADDDLGRIATAAWVLVQAEHGDDYQDSVIDAMVNGEPPARAAITRALALAPRADLSRVMRRWSDVSPAAHEAVFGLLSPREPDWAGAHLEASLRSGDSSLVTAALRSLRRMPGRAIIGLLEDALSSEAPEVRAEAIASGVALRSDAAWEACRDAANDPGDGCRLPLGLLAISAHPQDRAVVRARVSDAKARRHAIWALGFAGDVEAADLLVEATEDETVAKLAGESLSAITGLFLGGAMVKPGKTQGPDVPEVGDDDPPPVVRSEDFLLVPNAPAVQRWWKNERSRFLPGVDYIEGRPRTPETVHAALATATMWRREALWLDLARTTGTAPSVDLKGWTADQRRQWGEGAAAPARGR